MDKIGPHYLNFSIAIATLNRPDVLKALLDSIFEQTILPKEVIIVDDSNNEKTKNLAEQLLKNFGTKKITLKYVRGGGAGLAQARNIGVTFSTSEIHGSLDDDVILHKDYIKEILKVYENYPDALGVAGHIENLCFSALSTAIGRVFSCFFTEQDKCRVFPTGISYPQPLTHIIESEWLSGTNSSYRRKILKKFKWDENLKRYSLCEDMDISYRIQTNHPKSLLMTPYAKVIHTNSQLARITSEYRTHMDISYHTYFFFKNMKQTYRNMLSFVYGIFFGRLVISITSRNPHYVVFTIKAQLDMMRNFKKVKRGIFKSF
jgi:cellulose synthase/poly-beta-1,6-N-acetylglucosamine synthase-like glycosyltransferase